MFTCHIFALRCGCQTYRSVEKLNPKRMITVKQFKAIIVSIRVLGREPRSSFATNVLFIASFSQGPAVFDLGSSGGLTGAHWGSPKKASSQKGMFVHSRAMHMASILLSHQCPPPGVLPATQLWLGSRTLRLSRWLDVTEGEQGGFSQKALSDFLFFRVLGVEEWHGFFVSSKFCTRKRGSARVQRASASVQLG